LALELDLFRYDTYRQFAFPSCCAAVGSAERGIAIAAQIAAQTGKQDSNPFKAVLLPDHQILGTTFGAMHTLIYRLPQRKTLHAL
jgi:hypothetical protein